MTRRYILIVLFVILAGVMLAACGGGDDAGPAYTQEQIDAGEVQYQATCSACHGADGMGIENLGRAIVGSEFVNEQSDTELVEYVKAGRTVDDPLNTTGIAMPPKGGNPALTDEQIQNTVAYIRSIQP